MAEEIKKKKTEIKLDPKVWEVPYNEDLIVQVLYVLLNNERKGTSEVKGRGEVSGGGRKPWKQKGTGRARHGSIRSPIWVGGGVTFGPNKRNWKKKINKKMKNKAVCVMLSERNREKAIEFKEFDLKKENREIREMVSKKLNKRLLVVSDDEKLNSALRNMEGIKIVQPMKVNVKNLVEARDILIDINSIDILEKRLTNGE